MDPAAVYAIHVDSDGDAVEDMSFTFNFSQTLPNDNAGVALMVGAVNKAISVRLVLLCIGKSFIAYVIQWFAKASAAGRVIHYRGTCACAHGS